MLKQTWLLKKLNNREEDALDKDCESYELETWPDGIRYQGK